MKSPIITVEEQAVNLTRQVVRHLTQIRDDVFAPDLSYFNPHDSQRMLIAIIKRFAMSHPFMMLRIVDKARNGADINDLALRELISEFANRSEPMPVILQNYNIEILAPGYRRKAARGPKKASFMRRDMMITAIVWKVTQRFNLRPTGRSKRSRSACSIVAEALGEAHINLSDKAVEAIWHSYGPQNMPWPLPQNMRLAENLPMGEFVLKIKEIFLE